MKNITNNYKNEIKKFGRQIDVKISYEDNEEEIELGKSQLNSVSMHYDGNILKSVMKQLDIESRVNIPIGTDLTCQFGVLVNNQYEYINLGSFIVKDSEKQEDTYSWKITCYDKLLLSMKDYVDINITYPITIRNYLQAICNYLDITFANSTDTFANYDKEIQNELYLNTDGNSIGYTFRDVLDELAQVTASTICINNDDELEIRYINDTQDTINEKYLKNVNVNFGEKYGPINSIVLSRAGGSDNIYLRDEESIELNGLCELKIQENQIMNFNDRVEYLPDLLEQLDGLEYYINDFSSTGITYYELCDMYNVSVDNNLYKCIMFNDEINITQGLEENIHTDMPEDSETDYKKADKTDRKINQTYIIVDKQNQKITSLANEVNEFDERITTVEQTVDGIEQTVEVIEDLKRKTDGISMIHFTDAVADRPLKLSIKNVEMLYPSETLYPSTTLYSKDSYLVVDKQNTLSENAKLYKLPLKTLYSKDNVYDEFVLERNHAYIIHRIGLNQDNTTYILQNETIEDLGIFEMTFLDGENYVYLYSFKEHPVIYNLEYLVHSEFTDTFTTETYVNSSINQTANQIMLQVNEKVDEEEIIAKLNVAVENGQGIIELKGNTVTIDSDKFKLDADGKIEATAGDIGGFNLTSDNFNNNIEGLYNFNYYDANILKCYIQKKLSQSYNALKLYDLNNDNSLTTADYSKMKNIIQGAVENDKIIKGKYIINSNDPKNCVQILNEYNDPIISLGVGGINSEVISGENLIISDLDYYSSSGTINGVIADKNGKLYTSDYIYMNDEIPIVSSPGEDVSPQWFIKKMQIGGTSGNEYLEIETFGYNTWGVNIWSSDKRLKHNIKDSKENALDKIMKIKHREFIYNNDDDNNIIKNGYVADELEEIDSQFIFEVGEDKIKNPNTSYIIPMLSKAIQEQQEQIEELKKEIEKLKGGK